MNPFVNPNKRDFLLPKGCKDLSDLQKRFSETKEVGLIADVEAQVRIFLDSVGASRFLMVMAPKEHAWVQLSVAEPQVLMHLWSREGDEEAVLRKFLSKHRLRVLHDQSTSSKSVPLIPGAKTYRIFYFLLPKDAKHIARITVHFFQQIHGIGAEAELKFRHDEDDVVGEPE